MSDVVQIDAALLNVDFKTDAIIAKSQFEFGPALSSRKPRLELRDVVITPLCFGRLRARAPIQLSKRTCGAWQKAIARRRLTHNLL